MANYLASNVYYAAVEFHSRLEKQFWSSAHICISFYDQIYLPSFVDLFPVLLQWF